MAADLAEQFAALMGQEQERLEKMKALSEEIAKQSSEHRVLAMDLERERRVARITQEETVDAKRQLEELKGLINRNSFVLVLIDADADGYIFKDKYYADVDGGRRAALDLRTAVQEYLKKEQPELAGLPIVVKAFANYDGLSQLLVKMKLLKNLLWLNGFAKGFSQAFDTCDFVLVGAGKDRADEKIKGKSQATRSWSDDDVKANWGKGVFKQFITNPTCRHVVFGACHDNGYVRLLEKYQQGAVTEKVTLLYPFDVGREFDGLGFRSTRMESLFRTKPFGKPPAPTQSTMAGGTRGAQSPVEASWAARLQSGTDSASDEIDRMEEELRRIVRREEADGIPVNKAGHRIDISLPDPISDDLEMWNRKTRNGKIRYCYRHHLLPEGWENYLPLRMKRGRSPVVPEAGVETAAAFTGIIAPVI
ncbi:uncharacterized protein DSM5745_08519 [Aspergillus mulundensis]|uniref:DUF7923 domain-containing protein n=1 Tax=Aspergillus mulundensis TaxID=1810919 RepID=A0A3D8R416_9EURO|nr:hypothetical protein DSM5745_08519 [Aspergillus mulundensis]RDW68759.1 hypothetical protein DSM5745_08519 [Aspergillus mulundensis]